MDCVSVLWSQVLFRRKVAYDVTLQHPEKIVVFLRILSHSKVKESVFLNWPSTFICAIKKFKKKTWAKHKNNTLEVNLRNIPTIDSLCHCPAHQQHHQEIQNSLWPETRGKGGGEGNTLFSVFFSLSLVIYRFSLWK